MTDQEMAQEIIKKIGGKDNIKSVTHCVTRLRFVLNDFSIPNKEEVASIDGVISALTQGGQFQVILGNKVNDVYDQVIQLLGDLDEKESDPTSSSKKSLFDTFSSTISGIFTPVLGPLAASGTIKGILAILQITNLLSESSGTFIVLTAISNSFFYFMPILLGASSAKYFKLNSYVGMLVGASLIYPTLIPYATEGSLRFLKIPINMMDYTSSVFPVIVAVWLASKIDKLVQKMPLQDLRFLIQPLIVLLVSVPIALIVIGPLISTLSSLLAKAVNAVYNFSPIIGGALIGGPWIILVMFGLHWAFIPIFINNIASQGFDPIMGLLLANQFAMAGATFAVGMKTKKEKLKALSYSTGATTLIGISEPALYGVLLPYKKPFIASIIGGSLGAIIAGAANTVQYAFGGSGLLGIPLIINPSGIDTGFYGGIASQAIGFISAFLITYFWAYKDSKELATTEETKAADKVFSNIDRSIDVNAIVSGEVVPLSSVPDKVFSEGMMGQGLAINPASGKFYAPFDAVVTSLLPSKHAIGLTDDNGIELLIHVGMDTVNLNGKYFSTSLKQNDRVKQGDLLLDVDLPAITKEGYSVITPIVVTNSNNFKTVKLQNNQIQISN